MWHGLIRFTVYSILMFAVTADGADWRYSRVYQSVNPTGQFFTTITGLDVLENDDFGPLRGKTVAVVTNQTGFSRKGEYILDLLDREDEVTLKVIFGPEHGLSGRVERGVEVEETESRTGVKVYSLYGQTRKPTPDQLAGVDVVIFDMQDVGARYYTYASTMTLVMDACARDGVPFWILDRPNPVRGDVIEGPLLEVEYSSFTGMHPVPIRHGLTLGELAIMINEEGWLSEDRHVRLTVVPLLNWSRYMWWDETQLTWIPPSPNIPTPETALVYLGACLFEGTNVSEGRGTHEPFMICGAPWIDGRGLAEMLNYRNLPGAEFEPVVFTPKSIEGMAASPKFQDQACGGARLKITDKEVFLPIHTTAVIIHLIRENYPHQFKWSGTVDGLWGSDAFRRYIDNGRNIQAHPSTYTPDRDTFYNQRGEYLIYAP
ncbi:exo-beta-N-acetylmuramidase NamZ domain-containing protein [Candidatus Neomarinimicrobiota bacterium]